MFREDLYYRLNVVHIEVPPLRERREDIDVLLKHYLKIFAETHQTATPEIDGDALSHLTRYHWPGNVRELKNVAERLVLRSPHRIEVASLPQEIVCGAGVRAVTAEATPAPPGRPSHEMLFDRMISQGASFWSEIYEPFMARDLTRQDVREIVRLGLEHTRGNYKLLVTSFNMPPEDYKKFLNFLRKYQCHVPFQRFRMVAADLRGRGKFAATA
jgi:DNA-binding NtrC family response regulator